MWTYNRELGTWEHGRNRFDILRLLMGLDELQLELSGHQQLYFDSGVAESARDRLPVSFWDHVQELGDLAGKVSALTRVMWEESGLNDERDRLTPLYRALLVMGEGEARADEIMMDLAARRARQ